MDRRRALLDEIDEKKKQIRIAQGFIKKYNEWWKEYDEALMPDVNAITGGTFTDVDQLSFAHGSKSGEIETLEREIERLEDQLEGRFTPVVDQLQPIVILA